MILCGAWSFDPAQHAWLVGACRDWPHVSTQSFTQTAAGWRGPRGPASPGPALVWDLSNLCSDGPDRKVSDELSAKLAATPFRPLFIRATRVGATPTAGVGTASGTTWTGVELATCPAQLRLVPRGSRWLPLLLSGVPAASPQPAPEAIRDGLRTGRLSSDPDPGARGRLRLGVPRGDGRHLRSIPVDADDQAHDLRADPDANPHTHTYAHPNHNHAPARSAVLRGLAAAQLAGFAQVSRHQRTRTDAASKPALRLVVPGLDLSSATWPAD